MQHPIRNQARYERACNGTPRTVVAEHLDWLLGIVKDPARLPATVMVPAGHGVNFARIRAAGEPDRYALLTTVEEGFILRSVAAIVDAETARAALRAFRRSGRPIQPSADQRRALDYAWHFRKPSAQAER